MSSETRRSASLLSILMHLSLGPESRSLKYSYHCTGSLLYSSAALPLKLLYVEWSATRKYANRKKWIWTPSQPKSSVFRTVPRLPRPCSAKTRDIPRARPSQVRMYMSRGLALSFPLSSGDKVGVGVEWRPYSNTSTITFFLEIYTSLDFGKPPFTRGMNRWESGVHFTLDSCVDFVLLSSFEIWINLFSWLML